MATIQDHTAASIQSFAADITAIVQRAALDAVRAALGGAAPTRAPAKKAAAPAKKPAAPAKKAAAKAAPAKAAPKAAPAKAAPAKKAAAAKRPLGAKRAPAEIQKLTDKVASYISSNPGQGVEAMGKSLGTPTSELTLPIKKLLGSGSIRFEGQRRATRYFPA